MITALILAGGIGSRVGSEIPKQFIPINGKPILAYTLSSFESHPLIDKIVVVCIQGYEKVVENYRERYSITKLDKVVTGGRSALESTRIGVNSINASKDDIIVIHDGVRPLVDERSISNVINDCKEYGGAISSIPLVEHVFFVGSTRTDLHYIPRENAYRTVTPQAYKYSKLLSAFERADALGISSKSPFIGTMMMDVGEPVCLSEGSDQNIKITGPADVSYFQSFFDENS